MMLCAGVIPHKDVRERSMVLCAGKGALSVSVKLLMHVQLFGWRSVKRCRREEESMPVSNQQSK